MSVARAAVSFAGRDTVLAAAAAAVAEGVRQLRKEDEEEEETKLRRSCSSPPVRSESRHTRAKRCRNSSCSLLSMESGLRDRMSAIASAAAKSGC